MFSKGQLMDKFGPGKHTLDFENILKVVLKSVQNHKKSSLKV